MIIIIIITITIMVVMFISYRYDNIYIYSHIEYYSMFSLFLLSKYVRDCVGVIY